MGLLNHAGRVKSLLPSSQYYSRSKNSIRHTMNSVGTVQTANTVCGLETNCLNSAFSLLTTLEEYMQTCVHTVYTV